MSRKAAPVLQLPPALAAALRAAAARAYPEECCGLIEGIETQSGWHAHAVHETENLAQTPRARFLIDPQAHFALLRALRGTERRVIGCFHSHPGGKPAPSATDAAEAFELDFVWLIAGGTPETGFALAGFVFLENTGFVPLPFAAAP